MYNEEFIQYLKETWDEIIDGEFTFMYPYPGTNHHIVAGNILFIFSNYLHEKYPEERGPEFFKSCNLFLSENNRFTPDGLLVCDPDKVKEDGIYGAPDLVVEVLFQSSLIHDRIKKKDAYEKYGVKEYWIVSTNDQSIEVYLLEDGRYRLNNVYYLYPDYTLEEMTDEEKANLVTEFKCHLFNDLTIRLEDVFDRILK